MKSLSRIVVLFGLLCAASNIQSATYYYQVYVNGKQIKVDGSWDWQILFAPRKILLAKHSNNMKTYLKLVDDGDWGLGVEVSKLKETGMKIEKFDSHTSTPKTKDENQGTFSNPWPDIFWKIYLKKEEIKEIDAESEKEVLYTIDEEKTGNV